MLEELPIPNQLTDRCGEKVGDSVDEFNRSSSVKTAKFNRNQSFPSKRDTSKSFGNKEQSQSL